MWHGGCRLPLCMGTTHVWVFALALCLLSDGETGPFSTSSASLNKKSGPGSADPVGLGQGDTEGRRLPIANAERGGNRRGRFPPVELIKSFFPTINARIPARERTVGGGEAPQRVGEGESEDFLGYLGGGEGCADGPGLRIEPVRALQL